MDKRQDNVSDEIMKPEAKNVDEASIQGEVPTDIVPDPDLRGTFTQDNSFAGDSLESIHKLDETESADPSELLTDDAAQDGNSTDDDLDTNH